MNGKKSTNLLTDRLLLVTALASLALPAQPQQSDANTIQTVQTSPGLSSNSLSPINIQYTGRLFGYYRVEPDIDLSEPLKAYDAEVQAKRNNLPPPLKPALLTRPGAFFRHREATSPDLLLGMGDNFGPEFGASIQQEFSSGDNPCRLDAPAWKAGQWDTYAPESLYKSEFRMPYLADCDNVTRFLMAAGYRAIVPGREDFLYTGTWLRRIAQLLRCASAESRGDSTPCTLSNPFSTNKSWFSGPMPRQDGKCDSERCAVAITSSDHKLHMLAANLRASVAPAKGVESSSDEDKSCPLLFASDLGVPIECGESDSSISASMDWLARIDDALKPEIHDSLEKQAQSSPAFAGKLIKNEISILQTIVKEAGAQSSSSKADCSDLAARLQIIFSFDPGATAAKSSSRAAAPSAQSAVPACPSSLKPLNSDLLRLVSAMEQAIVDFKDARSPLLNEYTLRSARLLLLHLIFNEQQDAGFTIATLPGGQRVLIIGVMGKETMQEVAPGFFRVYPDFYDCRNPTSRSDAAAAQTSSNPVCKLKEKLYPALGDTFKNSSLAREAIKNNDPYQITVGDPLIAAEAVLRAVWANEQREGRTIDRTILMAQMPATEAEEVATQLRYDFADSKKDLFEGHDLSLRPRVDLVLSEAQDEHISGNQVAEINPLRSTVVLSPPLAYDSIAKPKWYPPSIATLSPLVDPEIPHGIQIRNTLGYIDDSSAVAPRNAAAAVPLRVATTKEQEPEDDPTSKASNLSLSTHTTAATLLESVIETELPTDGITAPRLDDLLTPWKQCDSLKDEAQKNCQNQVLTNYLLHTLQIHYKTSAAMLKRRDFWFDNLASGYDGYEFCDHWAGSDDRNAKAYCRLHVALDRVLWRGDYAVRVLVDGTTLASVLKSSSQATAIETTRLANDLHEEWLSTFGLVSTPPTNLVAAASGPGSFSLPGVSDCNITPDPPLGKKSAAPTPPPYCVDGFAIAPDAAYWIATSAQLAEDQSTYKDIQTFTQTGSTHFVADTEKSPTGRNETFLTTAIAEEIIPNQPPHNVKSASVALAALPNANSVQDDLARIEAASQKRALMQLDISKFAAGYTFTAPSIDDTDLGNDLSGVSNTQAATLHSTELDLESTARAITAPIPWQRLAFGLQNDFEFDHKRTGNTGGKPATVTYQLNSENVGAFAQIHILQNFGGKSDISPSILGPRNLPRFYWVIAPYQYQRQIVGSPLDFSYLTPPYTLTVTVPISDGFNWKSGLRFEAGGLKQAWAPDSGSYVEIGPEYVIQNHILYSISMPDLIDLSNPVTTDCSNPCLVTAGTSITTAVQNYYKDNNQTLSGSSNLVPLTRTVHAGGFYWTAHVQKVINKAKTYSFSFDTAGDSYLIPGYTLSTQTRYAINNKLAFNMNFLGNLSFSPTYSVFNFENQGEPAKRISVNTTSLEVMLKWYYGRDTQSPAFRLLWFTGPKSGDQTTSTKMK